MHQFNDTQRSHFSSSSLAMRIIDTFSFLPTQPPLFFRPGERMIGRCTIPAVETVRVIFFEIGQIILIVGERIGEGRSSVCKFDERNPERPYIRFNGVFCALYTFRLTHRFVKNNNNNRTKKKKVGRGTTYTHIDRRPHKCVRQGIDKLS